MAEARRAKPHRVRPPDPAEDGFARRTSRAPGHGAAALDPESAGRLTPARLIPTAAMGQMSAAVDNRQPREVHARGGCL